MSKTLSLQFLESLVPGGIGFGSILLVEFEPHSVWYEASLTATAQALRLGSRTEYHTFQHIPNDVRATLSRLELDVKRLENDGVLKIVDSYTCQTGLGDPETRVDDRHSVASRSLKLSDWSISTAQEIKAGVPEEDKRWLHIDDNTSVLNRYNGENAIIDYWRTRGIPETRVEEAVVLHSLLVGVASDAFYKQFESLCDGIIDFKSEEKSGQIEHYVRARIMRSRPNDSRWRRLKILENGEVTLEE